MMNNKKNIEELTSERIKNMGLEEPSADFTRKIMQSVALLPKPKVEKKQINYWYLSIVPVIGLIWLSLVVFKLTNYVIIYWQFFKNGIHPFITSMINIFSRLKNVSPIIIISFIAVLILLVIEEVISRNKQYVR
jgi:hypothetical protein